jgi:hypothetical protein
LQGAFHPPSQSLHQWCGHLVPTDGEGVPFFRWGVTLLFFGLGLNLGNVSLGYLRGIRNIIGRNRCSGSGWLTVNSGDHSSGILDARIGLLPRRSDFGK